MLEFTPSITMIELSDIPDNDLNHIDREAPLVVASGKKDEVAG